MLSRRSAVLAAITLAAGALTVPAAHAADTATTATAPKVELKISRKEVLSRANFWAKRKVPYSQHRTYPDPQGRRYRTDASGYISMAWTLSTPGLTTWTLPYVASPISKNSLQAGDILLKHDEHVVLFERWANAAKTKYWAYEQTPPHVQHHILPYPYWHNNAAYKPYRYRHIS